jgi:asparagine synthase (glutamine-hydrolysing)
LEVRRAVLDRRLAGCVGALPESEERRRNGTSKALLSEALADLLPAEILAQKKRTFTLPWEDWLRGSLRKQLEVSFAEIAPGLAPYLRVDGVREVWGAFLAGKTSWSRPWSIYALNEWCRRNL